MTSAEYIIIVNRDFPWTRGRPELPALADAFDRQEAAHAGLHDVDRCADLGRWCDLAHESTRATVAMLGILEVLDVLPLEARMARLCRR